MSKRICPEWLTCSNRRWCPHGRAVHLDIRVKSSGASQCDNAPKRWTCGGMPKKPCLIIHEDEDDVLMEEMGYIEIP